MIFLSGLFSTVVYFVRFIVAAYVLLYVYIFAFDPPKTEENICTHTKRSFALCLMIVAAHTTRHLPLHIYHVILYIAEKHNIENK